MILILSKGSFIVAICSLGGFEIFVHLFGSKDGLYYSGYINQSLGKPRFWINTKIY